MKGRFLFSIAAGVLLSSMAITAASANTSDALERFTATEKYYEMYQQEQKAPSSITDGGNENIMTAEGTLGYTATDLSLPGKAGFDLNITRRYNSNENMDTDGRSYMISMTKQASQSKRFGNLPVYPYYVNGNTGSAPVYVAFDSEQQMLELEENGTLYVSSNYTQKQITDWSTLNYTFRRVSNDQLAEFVSGTPFYYINGLTSARTVALVRDRSKKPGMIQMNTPHGYDYLDYYFGKGQYLNDGWSFAEADLRINKIGIDPDYANTSQKLQRTLEVGSFTDPENGMMVYYEAQYRDLVMNGWADDDNPDFYPYQNKVIGYTSTGGQANSYMYTIQVRGSIYDEIPVPDPDNWAATTGANDWRVKITRYDGVSYYFSQKNQGSKNMVLVRKSDRYGNNIYYYQAPRKRGIVDTYGRDVQLAWDTSGNITEIQVDGIPAVRYEFSEENSGTLDPYNILTEDNVHKMKVIRGDNTNHFVTYTSKKGADVFYIADVPNTNLRATVPKECFLLQQVETSAGGKIKYEYGKAQLECKENSYVDRDRTQITRRAEFVKNSSQAINPYTYTYEVSDLSNLATVTSREGSVSQVREVYNRQGNKKEEKITQDTGITTNVYTYQRMTEGNYLPTQIQSTLTNWWGNNGKSITITKTYNNRQQLTKESDGLNETIITYDSTYGLVTRRTQKQTDMKVVGVSNTLSSDKKSILYVRNISKLGNSADVVYEKIGYNYSDQGEVVGEKIYKNNTSSELLKETVYTYSYPTKPTAPQRKTVTLIKTQTTKNVQNITDAMGENPSTQDVIVQTQYDYFGNPIRIMNGNGGASRIEYDSLQRPVSQFDALGEKTTISYDDLNNIIYITDPKGTVQKMAYDSLGREQVVSVGISPNNYSPNNFERVRQTQYDQYSRVTKVTLYQTPNQAAGEMNYTYYADDQVKSEMAKQGDKILSKKEYEYDPGYSFTQRREQVILADGVTINTYSDRWGRKQSQNIRFWRDYHQWDCDSTFTTDVMGNILTSQDFRGNTTKYEYDHQNRVKKTTNALGKSATVEFDSAGNQIKSTDYNGNSTTMEYNTMGKLINTLTPISGTTISASKTYYDKNGNPTRQEQQSNKPGETEKYRVTRYLYDALNRNTAVINNDGLRDHISKYEYDANGNLETLITGLTALDEQIRPQVHNITTFTYDRLNRQTGMTDPMGLRTSAQYDNLGNLLSTTDKNGNRVTRTYDGLGHVLTQTAGNNTVEYEYNLLGLVSKMTDSTGVTTYEYDPFGNLTREEKGNIMKTYKYDENGNRTDFELQDGRVAQLTVSYEYDALNRLTKVTSNGEATTYTYDNNGNLLTENTNNKASASYSYNKANMLTGQTDKKASNTTLTSYGISYYLDGNRAEITESGKPVTRYTYDQMGRLKTEEVADVSWDFYVYDNYQNRQSKMSENLIDHSITSTSYDYDRNNRLLREAEQTGMGIMNITDYYYDANGNQILKIDGTARPPEAVAEQGGVLDTEDAGTDVESYTYNELNQLVKVRVNNRTTTYTYDGNGLRQSKNSPVYTAHIYDGPNVIMDKTYNQKQIYHRGLNLISKSVGENKEYYHRNPHGDVIALTNATGAVTADYRYDAFGNQLQENTEDTNPFRYAGEYYDYEIGNIYLRNRYYSPGTGRFISEDPIRDGLNWYVYCGNNPANCWDPLGLAPGDSFKTLDEAALDAADYYMKITVTNDEEMCGLFYQNSDGTYTYYDVANVAADKKRGFDVSWTDNAIAFIHTHVFYDVNNPNDNFSSPGNTTGQMSNGSGDDETFAQNNNITIYMAAPTGEVKEYDPTTQQTSSIGNITPDPKYTTYQQLSKTWLWGLIEYNYPLIDKMDIVKARVKFPDDRYKMLQELNIVPK